MDWLALFIADEAPLGFDTGELLRSAITVPVVVLVLYVARKWVARASRSSDGNRLRGQVFLLVIANVGLIAVILSLPIAGERRDELLRLVGLLLSAAIALSSTTFLGNMLAGFMVRSLGNLRVGEFLRVDEHFGRVTERGLFHTEIQTEDRDLTTIPNLVLATRPMTVVRSSGTIVSASVSLGYETPHERVRELLTQAALAAGLSDPFVRVVELGDFTIEYRVGGMLTETKELLSRRTALRTAMLDALHGGGVEIASPAILTTRSVPPTSRFVPREGAREAAPAAAGAALEALAFDKADVAESVETLREEIQALHDERDELEKRHRASADEDIKQALADELERMTLREARLAKVLELRESELGDTP